jgi:Calcium-dependent channel, 7TM region, putative phosphate
MTVFATLFFWVFFVVSKYQLYYVFDTEIETGGSWFPRVFLLRCVSMMCYQLFTFGGIVVTSDLPSKGANVKLQSLAVIFLAPITFMFDMYVKLYLAPRALYQPELMN